MGPVGQAGYHLWSERYDRDLDDVFAVQDEIARAIVDKLKVKLAGDGEASLVKRPTHDLDAYHLYLQGRHAWLSRRDAEGLRRAIECFEQAISRDPAYAIAHAGLADVYSAMGTYDLMAPREAFGKGKPAAERAVALDGELAEAHYALASVRTFFDWDFAAGERACRGFGPAWGMLSILLSREGRHTEAVEASERYLAVAHRNPRSLFFAALPLFRAGRRAEGDERVEELRTRAATRYASPLWFAYASVARGDYSDTLTWLERAHEERTPSLIFLNAVWWFDELRTDPRFEALTKRIGLPSVPTS